MKGYFFFISMNILLDFYKRMKRQKNTNNKKIESKRKNNFIYVVSTISHIK